MTNQTYCQMLAEFCDVFQPPDDPAFWATLIDEETREVTEACAHLLKELADLLYVITGYDRSIRVSGLDRKDIPDEQRQVIFKAVSVLVKTAYCVSDDQLADRVFQAVHQSNMSKLDDNGQPIRDPETGKVLKGPNYKAPDIEALIFGDQSE